MPEGDEPAEIFVRLTKKGTTMNTQEIPRDGWSTFLNTFSRQHEGWLATLEVFADELGAQEAARELPLEGISSESTNDGLATITINLGRNADDHLTHEVNAPTHLWLQQTQELGNAALEIESAEGTKTLLRFRTSLPSEMIDGGVMA
jgi:Family of unknown function (DUF5335)